MATDSTAICNLSLMRMGQDLIDDIDEDDVLEEKCAVIYAQARDEVQVMGPELGWKFTRRRNRISVDSHTITVFADYSGTATGTVLCTAASHGLVSGEMVTISGTTSYNGDFEATRVSDDTFYFTDTWVANDATGTAHWTSEEFLWRFARPTCLKVTSVNVGGVPLTDWVREGEYILTNLEEDEVDMIYVQSITDTTLFPSHFTRVLVLKLAIELTYNITQDLNAAQLLGQELVIALSKAIAMDEREKYVAESSNSWVEAGR